MADKKVERNVRSSDEERPVTPTQKMQTALSKTGTLSMADTSHDKGKAALLDRFRQREERYRKEQSLRAQAAAPSEPPAASEDEEGRHMD
jgi:hypothetical protein